MATWDGRSKGKVLGYKIFVFILKYLNIKVGYFVLRFVVLYYYFFSDKASLVHYFEEIHGFDPAKTKKLVYKNFYIFGQILLDKIAILAGLKDKYSFTFVGEEYLRTCAKNKNGCVILGFHVGNGEIAGKLLERIDAKVNVVMFDNEDNKLKDYLDNVQVDKHINFIFITPDSYDYIHKMTEALKNKEFLAIFGDRFIPGTTTTTRKFMGQNAEFATGPLHLAAKHGVPVTFASMVKDGTTHYHFNATEPKIYPYPGNLIKRKESLLQMLDDYIAEMERIVKKHPLQWFNYYKFWNETEKE